MAQSLLDLVLVLTSANSFLASSLPAVAVFLRPPRELYWASGGWARGNKLPTDCDSFFPQKSKGTSDSEQQKSGAILVIDFLVKLMLHVPGSN